MPLSFCLKKELSHCVLFALLGPPTMFPVILDIQADSPSSLLFPPYSIRQFGIVFFLFLKRKKNATRQSNVVPSGFIESRFDLGCLSTYLLKNNPILLFIHLLARELFIITNLAIVVF